MASRIVSPLLLLLSTLLSNTLAQCGKDYCTLDCNNHGLCCMGEADYSDTSTHVNHGGFDYEFHQNTSISGMHCRCQTKYTDVNCETDYQYCDIASKPCFHGGICVDGTIPSNGQEVHLCDCQNAMDDGGVEYIGIHCELPVPPSDGSESCNADGSDFCINGGQCKPQE